MMSLLRRREITGKKFPINDVLPLRKTTYRCFSCYKTIYGVIIDINEDKDIWNFRYHYFIPWNYCHKCKHPLAI